MCEVIQIKSERKRGLKSELKVSPQIAQVTNIDLSQTRVWERGVKVGKEREAVGGWEEVKGVRVSYMAREGTEDPAQSAAKCMSQNWIT